VARVATSRFQRGFKAEAERISLELRAELGLGPHARFDPHALAEHLGVPVRTLRDLAGVAREHVAHFLGRGCNAFSAATIYVSRYKRLIITNPAHALTRRVNSVGHELSHIVLEHEAEAPLQSSGARAWNGRQEREADWLAGCFLIPQQAAHAAALAGRTVDEVAVAFGVSRALASWRMNETGALIRASRRARS
jgi:Zn-dependent peptidase ImmA (M78 family)